MFKFAADARKMMPRYSQLCEAAFDTLDAVKLEIPEGLKFLNLKMHKSGIFVLELTACIFS
jgi:hypothetical protein